MEPTHSENTTRTARIEVSGQVLMACEPLAIVAANIKEREKDFADLKGELHGFRKETTAQLLEMHKDIKALNHAKKEGGTAGGITGAVASGVALFGYWLWTKITGG
jgi:hypothetical protein